MVPTCAMALPYCGSAGAEGIRSRQLCPHTCGCSNPYAPIALWGPENGCRKVCNTVGSTQFNWYMKNMPCEDLILPELPVHTPREARVRAQGVAQPVAIVMIRVQVGSHVRDHE